jgi:predicted enzyme related to lactoylglutathione lyase
MSFLGLRTCIYKVTNLEQAKAWYTEVLGYGPYFDQPFYVGFNVQGYELGLIPEEGEATISGEGVHAYWGMEDVHAAYERLLELGASTYEAPNDVGDGIIVATVKDPWGNLLCLICNPHFKLP